MYKYLDVRIKLIHLVFSIVLIFNVTTYLQICLLLLISVILLVINKISIKKAFKYISYIVFISIFITFFHFIVTKDLSSSLYKGIFIFLKYVSLIIYSLNYKYTSTNKEIAFSLIYPLKPFKGYINLNKVYTIILLVLNQINQLAIVAKNMYYIRIYNFNYPTLLQKFNLIISLLGPLINQTINQNDNVTVTLINKGYNYHQHDINVYHYNNKQGQIIFIIGLILLQCYLMGGL